MGGSEGGLLTFSFGDYLGINRMKWGGLFTNSVCSSTNRCNPDGESWLNDEVDEDEDEDEVVERRNIITGTGFAKSVENRHIRSDVVGVVVRVEGVRIRNASVGRVGGCWWWCWGWEVGG